VKKGWMGMMMVMMVMMSRVFKVSERHVCVSRDCWPKSVVSTFVTRRRPVTDLPDQHGA
jgi:hypothetical protein